MQFKQETTHYNHHHHHQYIVFKGQFVSSCLTKRNLHRTRSNSRGSINTVGDLDLGNRVPGWGFFFFFLIPRSHLTVWKGRCSKWCFGGGRPLDWASFSTSRLFLQLSAIFSNLTCTHSHAHTRTRRQGQTCHHHLHWFCNIWLMVLDKQVIWKWTVLLNYSGVCLLCCFSDVAQVGELLRVSHTFLKVQNKLD